MKSEPLPRNEISFEPLFDTAKRIYSLVETNSQALFRFSVSALVTLLSIASALVFYSSFSPRMLLDDFGFLANSEKLTTWGMLEQSYLTWTGRYSWIVLIDVYMKVFGGNVSLLLPFMLASGAACWYWVLRRNAYAMPIITAALLTAINCTGDVGKAFWWFAAYTNILPPLLFLPLLVPLSRTNKPSAIIGGFVVAFILAGFNEQGTMVVAAVAGLLLLKRTVNKAPKLAASSILLGSIFGMAAMVLAPGNVWRAHSQVEVGNLSTRRCIEVGAEIGHGLIANVLPKWPLYFPTYLDLPQINFDWSGVTLFWLIIVGAVWGQKIKPSGKAEWRHALAVLIAGYIFCVVMMIVTVMAIRVNPSMGFERTLFIPHLIAAGTFATIGYQLRAMANRPPAALVIVLLISLPFGVSSLLTTAREVQRECQFARDWDAQDATIRELKAKGTKSIILKPLVPPYTLIMWGENPKVWPNTGVAKYYDIDSIKAPRTP